MNPSDVAHGAKRNQLTERRERNGDPFPACPLIDILV